MRLRLTPLLSPFIRLWHEEDGQDLLEYGLLTGIIGISTLILFTSIVPRMTAAYQEWNAAQEAVWEPNAPTGP